MRRSGPGGGGGAGGFSKPPPAPLTHGGSGRVRLHTPEVNGTLGKDRFGSPRERSPSLVSSLPLSPSHPSSREKSPNPASQDLHDCSMCLSAYIQSLNTVCGTACRLSQCLAQVSSESGFVDSYANAGQGAPQPVREAADAWEGVARAVGVASAAVKTQMLMLLQEVQSRQDMSENTRRQEINRVTQAMLSAFLGLQYQFSAVVIERFTGILQALRDDSQCVASQNPPGLQMNKQCHSSIPISNHVTDVSQLSVSSQYVPQLPGQPAWLPGQPQQQGGIKGVPAAPLLESPGKEDKPRSRHPSGGHSRHSSAAPGWSNPGSSVACPSTTNYGSNSNYGSSLSLSMNSGNTLSPGTCYGLFSHLNGGGSGWHSDAISRRWSMGGPSAEGWERNSSLGPFSLIANRRWSVPEASEHDVSTMSEADSVTDFYGSCGLHGEWNGTIGGSTSWGSRVGLHVPSRDSSVTRSPSHSRSVTPDPGRQGSFISNEELQDVIDLLSLPLTTDANTIETGGGGDGGGGNSRGSSGGGGSSGSGTVGGGGSGVGCGSGGLSGGVGESSVGVLGGGGGTGTSGGGSRGGSGSRGVGGPQGASPVGLSPTHHPCITQLFEEANKQQKQQQLQLKTQQQQQPTNPQPPQKSLKQQQPPPQQQQYREQLQQPLQYHQQQQYPQQQSAQPPQHQQYHRLPPSKGCTTPHHSLGEVVVEAPESNSQVSTPIWPPSGIAPVAASGTENYRLRVTLTECSSGEEKPTLPLWTDGIGCERRSNPCHGRDAPNRASWPAASTLLWAGLDGMGSEGEGEEGGSMSPIGLPQYRRHSTDTTHLGLNSSSPMIAKTRSTDNITVGNDVSSAKSGCLDSNLQHLLLLNSILPTSSPATPTSQYSLFSSTT
ncbi:AT-rich interactive domain-containing protein 1A-like isoform X2 [Homarus americanus]|uniref:AT-rich interactive domain-containing protein 1A-like isoform X2 n=1 Tax=Homarus americanus TaxID=6706 RepID=UPI001C491E54|nr:AT-rich interactive domain-containing protein 1A-like isoform X2 [Homarus americanus]